MILYLSRKTLKILERTAVLERRAGDDKVFSRRPHWPIVPAMTLNWPHTQETVLFTNRMSCAQIPP